MVTGGVGVGIGSGMGLVTAAGAGADVTAAGTGVNFLRNFLVLLVMFLDPSTLTW